MSLFRVYVDGALFYHPQMSKLEITAARIEEDAENIDSMTLSAPFNHPYLSAIRPLASTIVCKKGDAVVFEGRALDNGTDFYNTHTWTCESCLAYLKDSVQPPYDYRGTLRGLLEMFLSAHNAAVEEKKQFVLGNVTVTDNNDYDPAQEDRALHREREGPAGAHHRVRYWPMGCAGGQHDGVCQGPDRVPADLRDGD